MAENIFRFSKRVRLNFMYCRNVETHRDSGVSQCSYFKKVIFGIEISIISIIYIYLHQHLVKHIFYIKRTTTTNWFDRGLGYGIHITVEITKIVEYGNVKYILKFSCPNVRKDFFYRNTCLNRGVVYLSLGRKVIDFGN